MCNAHNHPPGCDCGWGGGWHARGYASSYSTRTLVTLPTIYKSEFEYDNFCSPSTCPICGESVYFVRHNGGSVWLDSLGYPWPKHPCFDEDNYSINLKQNLNESDLTIFGVVIEVEATNPGFNGRIVVKCSDGTVINSIFNYEKDIKFWLGKLVVVKKKDENISLITVSEGTTLQSIIHLKSKTDKNQHDANPTKSSGYLLNLFVFAFLAIVGTAVFIIPTFIAIFIFGTWDMAKNYSIPTAIIISSIFAAAGVVFS